MQLPIQASIRRSLKDFASPERARSAPRKCNATTHASLKHSLPLKPPCLPISDSAPALDAGRRRAVFHHGSDRGHVRRRFLHGRDSAWQGRWDSPPPPPPPLPAAALTPSLWHARLPSARYRDEGGGGALDRGISPSLTRSLPSLPSLPSLLFFSLPPPSLPLPCSIPSLSLSLPPSLPRSSSRRPLSSWGRLRQRHGGRLRRGLRLRHAPWTGPPPPHSHTPRADPSHTHTARPAPPAPRSEGSGRRGR
jgi:hypothetical protein